MTRSKSPQAESCYAITSRPATFDEIINIPAVKKHIEGEISKAEQRGRESSLDKTDILMATSKALMEPDPWKQVVKLRDLLIDQLTDEQISLSDWEEEFDKEFNGELWLGKIEIDRDEALANSTRQSLKEFIRKVRQDAKAEMAREALRISRAAFSRMQLVAEELANRQGDDQARKLIYDIKEKYEELIDQLTSIPSEPEDKNGK